MSTSTNHPPDPDPGSGTPATPAAAKSNPTPPTPASARPRGRVPPGRAAGAPAARPTPTPAGALKILRPTSLLLPDWRHVRPADVLADATAAPGRAVPRGTPDQQRVARRLKVAALAPVLAVLDLLCQRRGGDPGLRGHLRFAALAALDRLDAKWWIEHGPVPAVPLAEELRRFCRPVALYRRALAAARLWRDGVVEGDGFTTPAEVQTALAQAQRLGYAVVGSDTTSLRQGYAEWCRELGLPRVVADLAGRYPWASGVVTSAEHALVSASPAYGHQNFSDDQRADLEASCAVCVSADDPAARVAVTSRGVTAIVPRTLAVPLAARLRGITAGSGAPDDPRHRRPAADGPDAGMPPPPGATTAPGSDTPQDTQRTLRKPPRRARRRSPEVSPPERLRDEPGQVPEACRECGRASKEETC